MLAAQPEWICALLHISSWGGGDFSRLGTWRHGSVSSSMIVEVNGCSSSEKRYTLGWHVMESVVIKALFLCCSSFAVTLSLSQLCSKSAGCVFSEASSVRRPLSPLFCYITDHKPKHATTLRWCLHSAASSDPLRSLRSSDWSSELFTAPHCWPCFFIYLFFLHPPAPDCLLTPLLACWISEWRQRRIWKLRRPPPG